MSELIPYVVKDTGEKLLIKRVSPFMAMELQKQFPEPKPPLQKVDIDGETVEQFNWADPDFDKEQAKYKIDSEARIRKLLIKRGVQIPTDNETWQDELAQRRAEWLEDFGVEMPRLDTDDKVDWVCYCAIGTDTDLEELYQAIMQRSQPTKEAVEAAKSGFPG